MSAPVSTPALIHGILSTMSAELDPGGDSPLDERDIFAGVVRDLLAHSSSFPNPPPLPTTVHTRLRALLTLARQRVAHTPFHLVSGATLRGYTDASVLLGVLFLLKDTTNTGGREAGGQQARAAGSVRSDGADGRREGEANGEGDMAEDWRALVRLLDRAIIVAGAVGPGRMGWVQALVGALQPVPAEAEVRGVKRRRASSPSDLPRPPHPRSPHSLSPSPPSSSPTHPASSHAQPPAFTPLFAPAPVPALSAPPPLPSPTGPFILRAYLSSGTHHPPWRAIASWPSAEYLLAKTGRGRLVPVECGRAYDDSGWTQRLVGWEGFLRRAGWDVASGTSEGSETPRASEGEGDGEEQGGEDADGAPQYLAQTSLFRQFPALEGDMAIPDYVWASPPDGYVPPPELLVNAWVGPGGHAVVSPAHTDPYYNCYAQVMGYKRVWLAPPEAAPHMYAYAGDVGDTDAGDAGGSLADEYMTNTSRVPLLRPAHDGSFPKLQPQFPAFFEHVYPRAMEAVLGPGDMLVMPPGWWHAMRGEGGGPCWSVSFWF